MIRGLLRAGFLYAKMYTIAMAVPGMKIQTDCLQADFPVTDDRLDRAKAVSGIE